MHNCFSKTQHAVIDGTVECSTAKVKGCELKHAGCH
jgi:hypothetical protein